MIRPGLLLVLAASLLICARSDALAENLKPIDRYFERLGCAALAMRIGRFDDETQFLDKATRDVDIFRKIIADGGEVGSWLGIKFRDGRYLKSTDYILGYDYAEASAQIDSDIRGDVPSDQWLRGKNYVAMANQIFRSRRCADLP
ncbi:MAG: hypothetical protein WBA44_05140 [Mesorhizobium sp.]